MRRQSAQFETVLGLTSVVVILLFQHAMAATTDTLTCSYHQVASCIEGATCRDLDEGGFVCECPTNLQGDGLKGANHTGCGKHCKFDSDCHLDAECETGGACICKGGYTGDGYDECNNRDECKEEPVCDTHARCIDNPGSFECQCMDGYEGDGFTCIHTCQGDWDCDRDTEHCVEEQCKCKNGYNVTEEGDCKDIDECTSSTHNCDPNAACTNTEGGYTCECKVGFHDIGTEKGTSCEGFPRTCVEVKENKPGAKTGSYEIDPDRAGPLPPIDVQCIFRDGVAITVIPVKWKWPVRIDRPKLYAVKYKMSLDHAREIIDRSPYCYQSMSFECTGGASLTEDNFYYLDGQSNKHRTWGGASTDNNCACGEIDACVNADSTCNCDGISGYQFDQGKITNKEQLLVTKVYINQTKGQGRSTIGNVMCAEKPFDNPLDCHDAKYNKNYNILTDDAVLIDFDGSEGPQEPELVKCLMTKYPNAGVTVITHDSSKRSITDTSENVVTYDVAKDKIKTLVNNSVFCMQEISLECQNVRLFDGDRQMGRFTDLSGNAKNYWGGALGTPNSCACAVSGTCEYRDKSCNCDILDGKVRSDSGFIINQNDLPVGSTVLGDFGGTSMATVRLGELMCSQRQFGIFPSCQEYRNEGYEESNTYLLDTDGDEEDTSKDNQPPFAAYCKMLPDVPIGITTVFHLKISEIRLHWQFEYLTANAAQLRGLTERSAYCTQAYTYSCVTAPLFVDKVPNARWEGAAAESYSYFSGNGSIPACACGVAGNCIDGHMCNCDASSPDERADVNVLINKDGLPMYAFSVDSVTENAEADIELGPLECFEVFPNCDQLLSRDRLGSEKKPENGETIVDVDGPGALDPIIVTCQETITIINALPEEPNPGVSTPEGPVEQCTPIRYYDPKGNIIPPETMQRLVDNPNQHCEQSLHVDCRNARITDMIYFENCRGEKQTGWAGSGPDRPECGCGITGDCGADVPCKCDIQDNTTRTEGAKIIHKARLPVCRVCLGLDAIPEESDTDIQSREAKFTVGQLKCSPRRLGIGSNCQHKRDQKVAQSGTIMVDPANKDPFPILCDIRHEPAVGISIVRTKDRFVPVPKDGIEYLIKYYVYRIEGIRALVNASVYCTQEVFLHCSGSSPLDLGSEYGLYSYDAVKLEYWSGNVKGSIGCKGGQCNCDIGGTDGGLVRDKDVLPLSSVKLGPSDVERTLELGDLKCYDIAKDCNDILERGLDRNPLENNMYTIDTDGPGPLEYFEVKCEFKKNPRFGVTVVQLEGSGKVTVEGQTEPGKLKVPVTYKYADPEQINDLTKNSGFCYQKVMYECNDSPLIYAGGKADGWLSFYTNEKSLNFGTGKDSNYLGCACAVLGTCEQGQVCRCSAQGYMGVEYAHILDRESMPLTGLSLGGQIGSSSSAEATVTGVRCGPQPESLPKNCHDALKKYRYKTGEVLIWPSAKVEPFLVFCDMEMIPKYGVTIIKTDWEKRSEIEYGKTYDVAYKGCVSIEQVVALVRTSSHCRQPMQYQCVKTKFLGETSSSQPFYFTGGYNLDQKNEYFGGGSPSKHQCSCGVDKSCGGSEFEEVWVKRECNCDVGDNVTRYDGGTLQTKSKMPVNSFTFESTGQEGSSGQFKLGSLFCAKTKFDIDECKLGFDDCDKNAQCVNTNGAFRCECNSGWQGLGRNDVATPSNGHSCFNNNECNMKLCPWSSTCEDTPGSFICTCNDGFRQEGPTECTDINECEEGTHNCHADAKCYNRDGTFYCKCKPGFRGNGTHCKELKQCSCFGDPHCMSFDGRALHYQGNCAYTMARDNCSTGGEPSFQVTAQFWPGKQGAVSHGKATWVENVHVTAFGQNIQLMQKGEIRINELRKVDPKRVSEDIYIVSRVESTVVYLTTGVEIKWDHDGQVSIFMPAIFKSGLCGLCGNYNDDPNDDWIVGPSCLSGDETIGSSQTNSQNMFGDSWASTETDATCQIECDNSTDPECSKEDEAFSLLQCNRVLEGESLFKECLGQMSDDQRTFITDSCVKDVCAMSDIGDALCKIAAAIADICSVDYKLTIQNYRDRDYCNVPCGMHQEYMKCDEAPPQASCLDILALNSTSEAPAESEDAPCSAGCYCKEGYLMQSSECVKEEECGCLYKDTYYAAGERIAAEGCSAIGICKPGNNYDLDEVSGCHEDASCGIKDGSFGCHCKDGYYGDGVESCKENPCILQSPCGENELCLPTNDNVDGYTCQCDNGFKGNCGNCTDINECETATHSCDWNMDCINTPGSFQCKCKKGLFMEKNRCKDINECQLPSDSEAAPKCGNNSRCVNRIGYYICKCCDGYELNKESGECEASDKVSAYTGTKCCTCNTHICQEKKEVCGTDGQTYKNMKELMLTRCEKGRKIERNYYGKCKDNCGDVKCPKYQRCDDIKHKIPTCVCEKCTPEDVEIKEPVCSSAIIRYTNLCLFKEDQCSLDREDYILKSTESCDLKYGGKLVGEWGEFGPCSVKCGKGVKVRTRLALVYLNDELKKKFPLEKRAACYANECDGTKCAEENCDNPAAVCVPRDDGRVACICPDCTNDESDPVCGKINDDEPRTFRSACDLQLRACDRRVDFKLFHKGHCDVTPVECSLVPVKNKITMTRSNGVECEAEVEQNECKGGCGDNPDKCCTPEHVEKDIVLTCTDGSQDMQEKVGITTGCNCKPKAKSASP